MKLKATLSSLLALCWLCCFCYAADVAYIDISPRQSDGEEMLEVACEFYGLDLESLYVEQGKEELHHIEELLRRSHPSAIIVSGKALSNIDIQGVMSFLQRKQDKKIPLLVIGVTPHTDPKLLSNFSRGDVIECRSLGEVALDAFYKVADLEEISQQLAGRNFAFRRKRLVYFIRDETRDVQSIIQVATSSAETLFPIFVKTMVDRQEVFFMTQIGFSESSEQSIWRFDRERFLEIAPLMMFLQYAYGERCWHSPGHYANLTIDDPWPTEPYGHLSYTGLLKEMEKANFHTTIAFIPWNYDRSEPDVVSLFRDHPDRFSICIHGNNHDHYEFYKYETNIKDPWPAKPLNVQEANIKQALARMEEFERLTGLSYERVMVFPHGIAPAKTLGLLKKYNFLATSNAGNIPLGSDEPNDMLFRLREVTLDFENFASLSRYPAKGRTKADIAIDLFLGNPVLFCGHHDLFKDGIDSFNELVEVVNNIEPSVEWQSLAYIARHLYLKRIRDDGNYDIRTFCRNIELENMQRHDLTYFVRKEEPFSPPVRLVTVDGEPYQYESSDSEVSLAITIPAGQSRLINIEYENDLDLGAVDISKNDPRVNRLRKLSDFRDMTLSKSVLGRAVIYLYYETDLYKLGLKRLAVICFALSAAIGVGTWCLLRYIRRHRVRLYEIDGQVEG